MRALFVLLLGAACIGGAAAGTRADNGFDSAALPAALPAAPTGDTAVIVAELEQALPAEMSVIDYGRFVIAVAASRDEAMRRGRRIARHDEQMREGAFPALEARRTIVILAADPAALRRIAKKLYPAISVSAMPATGFYHRADNLILTTTGEGEAALWGQLMQSLMQNYNPHAPRWFEQAAATLYETSEWRSGRLTPRLDERMHNIPAHEDLSYDIFAGVCDCTPASAEQLALMRMLLVFLYQRDELKKLQVAVKEQGAYTTLLQALEAMDFDGAAWKDFAERSVRTYSP